MKKPITTSDLDQLVTLARKAERTRIAAVSCHTRHDHEKAYESEDELTDMLEDLQGREGVLP